MTKNFHRFFLLATLSFSLAACGSTTETSTSKLGDSAAAPVAQETTIRVGANVGFAPFEFMEGDQLVGVEIDILTEVGKRLNSKVEWINTPWNGMFAALRAGKFDVAIAGITIKPERLKELDFTSPYYDNDQGLTVRADSGIKSVDDLKGKIVGVAGGTTGHQWAEDNKEKYGFKDIKLYNSTQESMMDLQAGRIDGELHDIPASEYYVKDKKELAVVQRIATNEKFGLAFKKGNPLRDEVNRVIDEMKKDGTLASIYKKWFGKDPEKDGSTVTILPVPTN
ncbi:amino acid ABC transporter substrate-binding protein [Brevibacillus fluminis]|uniref:Amino acid ABC transporter substrate-binding protein n=1 Tax=Brevibacillus fluminis TaxID=511487 RepID=A0A3M8D9S2_9BACL|nr:ABC transporter substrate-binding protein [Brevibacillus fluminis]RNB84653.1 amino acid ABC transporter substrate-binding protein [Brevibacillus fluminis]